MLDENQSKEAGIHSMKVDENTVARFRKAVCDAGFWELEERIQTDEIMKNHISFRVGGPAQLYVEPSDLREVIAWYKVPRKVICRISLWETDRTW